MLKHLLIGLLASAVLIPAANADDDYLVWDHFPAGYYVEIDEAGNADCSRPGDVNWIYLHPDRREDATIPGVFSSFEGWLAFSFNGQEEDYFLEDLGGYGYDLDEGQQEMIRDFFNGLIHSSAYGVALSGGGLGYTTGGKLSLEFGLHVDTGEIHVREVDFEEYGRTRGIVTAVEDINESGLLLDGRPLRPLRHCP